MEVKTAATPTTTAVTSNNNDNNCCSGDEWYEYVQFFWLRYIAVLVNLTNGYVTPLKYSYFSINFSIQIFFFSLFHLNLLFFFFFVQFLMHIYVQKIDILRSTV